MAPSTTIMWCGTRNEHASRGGFDGDVVRASVALDIELFNLERLRVPDVGRGKAACEENQQMRSVSVWSYGLHCDCVSVLILP